MAPAHRRKALLKAPIRSEVEGYYRCMNVPSPLTKTAAPGLLRTTRRSNTIWSEFTLAIMLKAIRQPTL